MKTEYVLLHEAKPRAIMLMRSSPEGYCDVTDMGVNFYTFVGARAPTMAQMGTHNVFWAPTKVMKAPTMVLPLGHPQWF